MENTTIAHVPPPANLPQLPGPPALHVECTLRALRQTVWVSVFLAQQLRLTAFVCRLTAILQDVDRQLADLELL